MSNETGLLYENRDCHLEIPIRMLKFRFETLKFQL